MKRNELINEIIYVVVSLIVYWLMTRDGPPIRIVILYHTFRASQAIARTAGQVGLITEHAYHSEITKLRAS